MKTILLSTLLAFGLYTSHACSCFYISDYFCPSATWSNENSFDTLYIARVKVTRIDGYYMDVKIEENLQHILPDNEITILGQDGLNCNLWLSPFSVGNSYILAIYESSWEQGLYDLSGCGRFWLPIIGDNVEGNISEDIQQQDYAAFRQSIAQCTGLTAAGDPQPASILLYPNPTAGDLFIDSLQPEQSLDYSLYNSRGQLLSTGRVNGGPSPSLSLAGLPAGVYLLRLQAGKAVLTRRVVLVQE